jgi:1-acyl-sn-glycerol-3-phosphate acyltransferase
MFTERKMLPEGPTIFVVNHFTRIETFFLPYHLHRLTKTPVWALGAAELFVGKFGRYLEQIGGVSTQSPDRDKLMVKTLLTSEASWIIFPEGRMVKSKEIMEKGRFMIAYAGGKHPPHTGAATLGLEDRILSPAADGNGAQRTGGGTAVDWKISIFHPLTDVSKKPTTHRSCEPDLLSTSGKGKRVEPFGGLHGGRSP